MRKLWLLAALTAGGIGCGDRTVLTRSHGRAYKEAFARQVANPQAGQTKKEIKGLDSHEAGAIAGGYRKALAPPASGGDRQPVLIMSSPKAADEGRMPPPSVPADR